MNPRTPYYPMQSMPEALHNGYGPVHNWGEMHPEPSMSNNTMNWNMNNRMTWKRNRNWQPGFYRDRDAQQPYPQKRAFNQRFPPNRFDNGGQKFYETNGHQGNWVQPHKTKPIKSPDQKDIKELAIPGTVATKKKRKPMSKSYPTTKWDEKDAEKALQTENDFTKNLKNQSLIIRFPDPELSKDIVKQFNTSIENVHFPQASTPRYCFAHLKENADISSVVAALEKIPFGQGFLSVDIKKAREENNPVSPKDVDPYTLYVGNLPINVTKQGVIQQFSGCTRIDIGHPQQMKNTRYAFVRFSNVDDAIKAYRITRNTQFESRSLIVRFRRINGNVGVPGETKLPNLPNSTTSSSTPTTVTTKTEEVVPSTISTASKPDIEISRTSKHVNNTIASSGSTTLIPDMSLVKNEPDSDYEDVDNYEPKPNAMQINGEDIKFKQEIKEETDDLIYVNNNEDEIETKVEEEECVQDPYQYVEENLEDDFDYDDDEEDEYDDDQGMELEPSDTFLAGDDDEEFHI